MAEVVVLCFPDSKRDERLSLEHEITERGAECEAITPAELPDVIGRADVRFVLDGDGRDVLSCFLRGSADLGSRTVLVASYETTLLSKMHEALARGVAGLFVRPVKPKAVVAKLALPVRVRPRPRGGSVPPPVRSPSSPPPRFPSSPPARFPSSPPTRAPSSPPVPMAPQSGPSLPPLGIRESSPPPRGSSHPPSPMAPGGSAVDVPRPAPIPRDAPSHAELFAREAPTSMGGPAMASALSPELSQLLSDAEAKVAPLDAPDVSLPSPEEEIEAVLPHDVLLALDAPIEDDADEVAHATDGGTHGGTHGGSSTTGNRDTTATGHRSGTQRVSASTDVQLTRGAETSAGTPAMGHPRPRTEELLPAAEYVPPRPAPPSEFGERPAYSAPSSPAPSPSTIPPRRAHSRPPRPVTPPPPRPATVPVAPLQAQVQSSPRPVEPERAVLARPGDALRALAAPIAARESAILCFALPRGHTYRVSFFGGDILGVASTSEEESLLSFLVERGDLLRNDVGPLRRKIPREGRYAAAALVAHGLLNNDEIWDVLRAHASWLLGKVVGLTEGIRTKEAAISGRDEPSVFGAATGACVFVEAVRRHVGAVDALTYLGGPGSRIGNGPAAHLLRECALGDLELRALHECAGLTVAELGQRLDGGEGEGVILIYALALLDVLAVMPDARGVAAAKAPSNQPLDGLDDDARRARVRARAALVDEGDYFALLGVSREATGYEIRRAFLALRREFEPARILTPGLVDLRDDVVRIVEVLEEAYDILRDGVRRDRYRRAIAAAPPS